MLSLILSPKQKSLCFAPSSSPHSKWGLDFRMVHELSSDSLRRHSFVIGWQSFFVFTWRTSPFLSGKVSTILPRGHEFLGDVSSTISTTSPTQKFLPGIDHRWRSCNWVRYSLLRRVQNISVRYWTCLHLQLAYWSSLWNTPGGNSGLTLSNKRWLGIKASR